MTSYIFENLTNNQHIAFDSLVDQLTFSGAAIDASQVRVKTSGADLGLALLGKTVWLDANSLASLDATVGSPSLSFANGSLFIAGDGTANVFPDWYGQDIDGTAQTKGVQFWGLGGADYLRGGSGNDYLVGNGILTTLNHVSRSGSTGDPYHTSLPTISADGRYVAFEGGWTVFGSAAEDASDIIVKDMNTGTFSNEHKSASGTAGSSGAGTPVISADGKVVTFTSAAGNLVPGGGSGASYDVYLSSLTGTDIERISVGSAGELAINGASRNPDLSEDGRYVVFESTVPNWASGGNITYDDIYLKDRETGALTRISTSTTGGDGNGESRAAKISADGRFVVFQSEASNLTANDTNGYADIFVWDREDGSLTNLTDYDPVTTGFKNNASANPDIAYGDGYGGIIVFETGKALTSNDQNGATDVYAFDMSTQTYTLVSCRADGTSVGVSSGDASISGDGRFVVFTGGSDTLVPGDSNGVADIFVKDLYTGQIALISKSATGVAGNLASTHAQISLGGEWIVFESSANTLASTDANGSSSDVFRVSNPFLRDTLVGGAGDDRYVIGRPDVITELANQGTDTVEVNFNNYTLGANLENLLLQTGTAIKGTGNGLANIITGNANNNILLGAAGNDTLNGGNGNDSLTGGNGNDRLVGGTGVDTMVGGLNDDTYVVDIAGDVTTELAGEGVDKVESTISWTLGTAIENLTLMGANAINGSGNNLPNKLVGNAAANKLFGNAGADTLDGGLGNDTLSGSAGNDVFLFSKAAGVGNVDTISDYDLVADQIRLDDAVFGGLALGALAAGSFVNGTAALDANDRILYDATTGILRYDADGNGTGAAVQFAVLTNKVAINATDFLVV